MSRSAFGHIEKRGNNVYRIQWRDKDGTRRSETVHGPKFVAQERLSEIQLGINTSGRSVTYSDYWERSVLPSISLLSENTQHEYLTSWRRYLEPTVGNLMMADTDWMLVEQTIANVPSTSGQRKCFRLWRKIMNMAMRDQRVTGVTRNPCDRSIHMRQHVKREKVLLQSDEVVPWLRSIRGIKYEAALLAMSGGGLRPGEALGLTWDDISRVDVGGTSYARLRINKSVVVAGNRKVMRDSTKNASSVRFVLIGEPWASRIDELRSDGYLVQNAAGEPSSPATVAHNYKDWCSRAGVTHVSLENLRSSYATIAGEAGCIDSLVSMAMGHSDGTTKGNNYQTSTMKGLAMVADQLSEHIWSTCPCGDILGSIWG